MIPLFSHPIPSIPASYIKMISKSLKTTEKSGSSISDLTQESFCKEWADITKSSFLLQPPNVTLSKFERFWTQLTRLFLTFLIGNSASIPTKIPLAKASFLTLKTCGNWTEIFPRQFCWTIQFTVSGTKSTTEFPFSPTTRKKVVTINSLKFKSICLNWFTRMTSDKETENISNFKNMRNSLMQKLWFKNFTLRRNLIIDWANCQQVSD